VAHLQKQPDEHDALLCATSWPPDKESWMNHISQKMYVEIKFSKFIFARNGLIK